ncbi:MAG: NHLP bacteriocin export ABC transporter permease/ATPase subunit [Candidatus Angelobacter sp.]
MRQAEASASFDFSTFSDALESLASILDKAWQPESSATEPTLRQLLAVAMRVLRSPFTRSPADVHPEKQEQSHERLLQSTSTSDATEADEPSPLALTCQMIGRRMGIRFVIPASNTGSIHRDLLAICAASRIKFRKVRLQPGWWQEDGGPILAFRKESELPVALLPMKGSRYQICDLALKTARRADKEAATELEKEGYVFYRPLPARISSVWFLIRAGSFGSGKDFRVLLFCGVAGGLLSLATVIATGVIVDQFLPAARSTELIQSLILLLACAFSMAMLSLTRSFALLRIESRMDAHLQTAIWDRLLSLPVPFFRKYSSGDLAVRSLGVNEIRKNLTASVASSMVSSLFSVFSLLLLFWFDWRLAIVANLLVMAAVIVGLAGGARQIYFERYLAQIRGQIAGLRVQLVNGISKLRSTGAESRAFAFWAKVYRSQTGITIRAGKVANVIATFTAVFPLICFGTMFALAAVESGTGGSRLTVGEFVAFMAAFVQFLNAGSQLSASAVSLMRIVPLYERISPILDTLPENQLGKKQPGALSGAIEFQNISFQYKNDSPVVLSNASFSIKPGEFVALVGPSGCGKSTCLRLLLGFEKPQSGKILYDGEELEQLDIELVRRQIGVVLQNGRLMTGSIMENIVGSALFSINEAWDAAALAALDMDIRNMPMGIHTLVGEGGIVLSAGQRQRLMIARAIIRKPGILLLDEATSALDNHTQSIVTTNLEQLKITRVVIAQRLSTIINADKIYVMDKGKIVQVGPYEVLIREKGLFQKLAHRQLV